MMNRAYQIGLLVVLAVGYSGAILAQDTVFNRVVTVERDYQPELKESQAISITPEFIQHAPQPNPVVYSTYSEALSVGYNLDTLPAWKTKFRAVESLNGMLDGAVGHRNSHLWFAYGLQQKNNISLDVYAKHDAYWGSDALSQSVVGAELTRHFRKAELYVGIEGQNEAYVYRPTLAADWRNLCTGNAKLGFRSLSNYPFQYRVEAGYTAFAVSRLAVEHHAQSHLDLWWTDQRHSAGVKGYVQNTFYSGPPADISLPAMRHNIRIEPFYAYVDKHIRVHAGVNLDMNIGAGELLSKKENLSFAPSPNVELEWSTLRNVLHLYANAKGSFGMGSLDEYMGYNRYLNPEKGLEMASPRAYTPVDAQVGIKLRPIKTLLLDIYGGYAYMKNAYNMLAMTDGTNVVDYQLWLSDIQRCKVGAKMHYHYRDILEINLGGNYYFYHQEPSATMGANELYQAALGNNASAGWTTDVFDRPDWDAYARIEAHIDTKWSIYSENYFAGTRLAYLSQYKAAEIRPIISLNIGGQYTINNALSVYLQLNDYLNRKDEIFYGYHSQGIHFLLGVRYKF